MVIDLVTYRRRGHNEADDPSLTQPLMYELIDAKRSVRKHYTESLIGRGDITLEEAEEALRHFQEQLEGVFQDSRGDAQASRFSDTSEEVVRTGQLTLSPMGPAGDILTGIDRSAVDLVVESQLTMPDGFTLHPRLATALPPANAPDSLRSI